MNVQLEKKINEVVDVFAVDQDLLVKGTNYFIEQLKKGLTPENDARGLPMIPTYVTAIPTGYESGLYLAADLGGTNFRVCSVDLKGDSTFELKQTKFSVAHDLMKGTSVELFSFLASKIKAFLQEHHASAETDGNRLKLGFTFSFPVDQHALGRGTLIRWTKGYDVQDAVNKDIVELLQTEVDNLKIPVHIVALANDTVGTLLSRAYSANAGPGGAQGATKIGCIFGTGTNGAYFEKLENLKKLDPELVSELEAKGLEGMVINTEWGSFDNDLKVLPNTKYDQAIDDLTANPGFHLFEKRISGMFLGELLRQVLVDIHARKILLLQYKDKLPHRLTTPWALDSEVLSHIEIDDSTQMKETELSLLQSLRLPTTYPERLAIQKITRAISKRAAYLSAIPLAGILIHTGALDDYYKEVDIGADGSVVEYYPGFKSKIRDALALTPLGPEGERRIHICIAKDGSGVGAALCASVA